MGYFCYIVECADGSYYTGWTTDPHRRTRQHNLGRGAKYTRQHCPVKLVYVEPMTDRSQAMRRENSIKRMTRAQKQRLIEKTHGEQPSESIDKVPSTMIVEV